MRTIWRERIIEQQFTRKIPWQLAVSATVGARLLSVALEDKLPTVWFELDPAAEKAPLIVYFVGYSQMEVPEHCRFVGTLVIPNHATWHVYGEE